MRAVDKSASEAADDTRDSGIPAHRIPISPGAAAVGALGGAVLGTFGGPIGIVIGALLGAVGGAGVGDVLGKIREHRRLHDARLDEDIGVIGGDIGAASPDQPAWIGAYPMGAPGGDSATVDTKPAEGPIPPG